MLKISLQTYSRNNADLAEILEAFAADLREAPWGTIPAITDDSGNRAGQAWWLAMGPNGAKED